MGSTTTSVRMAPEEKDLIVEYSKVMGLSVSDFMRRTALERIEDELDLKAWHEAKAEYDADPVSYSHEEIGRDLGLL